MFYYREFAKVAEEEGFIEIATAFKMISTVEAEHERRYLKLLSRLTDGNFFKRDGKIWWQCRNCGFVIEAEEAPKLCPACKHPQAYFEPKKENYWQRKFASWRPCIGTVQGRLFLRRRESLPGSRLSLGREGARFPALICRFVSEDCGIFIIFAG